MLNAVNAPDVLSQMWLVIQVLAPLYAIFFGLFAVRLLIDKALAQLFPKPSKSKRPRKSVFYDRRQYPGLRYYRSRRGLRVSWFE